MKRLSILVFTGLLIVFLSACGGSENGSQNEDTQTNNDENQQNTTEKTAENNKVLVSLTNADGKSVATATLTEDDAGVHIKLIGKDLPKGEHAFHIHEKGVCEKPDFKSAGGHYNPTNSNHGKKDPKGPHAGDLKNFKAGEDGMVNKEYTTDRVTLEEGEENTLFTEDGTALVIHSGADDYKSQPSGDAGKRIACGAIEK